MPIKLSPHFTLEELTQSDTADKHHIKNTPTAEHMPRLISTAEQMEAVRELFDGAAVDVSSGYRNPVVNELVGGVPDSAHAKAYAVDFKVRGLATRAVVIRIRDSKIKYDQLIHESGSGRDVVHISFDPRYRRQTLSQPGKPGSPVFAFK